MKKCFKWIVALVSLIIFMLIAEDVCEYNVLSMDETIYNSIKNIICPPLTEFFKVVTNFASIGVFAAASIIIYILIKEKNKIFYVILNLVDIMLLNQVLKIIFSRVRPDAISIIDIGGYSFPSGHAMAAMAFYGFVIFLIYESKITKELKRLSYLFFSFIILLISFSRIYLGVHFASDVIAGLALSLCYLIIFTNAIGDMKFQMANTKLLNSFKYAFYGIKSSIQEERNMLIHVTMMLIVIIAGIVFKISAEQWIVCLILFGMVIGAELFNTAIEGTIDICMPDVNPKAKLAKDTSAGAVLVISLCAAIIGLIIFIPKIYQFFM